MPTVQVFGVSLCRVSAGVFVRAVMDDYASHDVESGLSAQSLLPADIQHDVVRLWRMARGVAAKIRRSRPVLRPDFVPLLAHVLLRASSGHDGRQRLHLPALHIAAFEGIVSCAPEVIRPQGPFDSSRQILLGKMISESTDRAVREGWLRRIDLRVWLSRAGLARIGKIPHALGAVAPMPWRGPSRASEMSPLEPDFRPETRGTPPVLVASAVPAILGEQSPSTPFAGVLGVSLQDAAVILNDQDAVLAREMVDDWQKHQGAPLPTSIGFDPNHKQVKLYAPGPLSDWAEKKEGRTVCEKHDLRRRLRDRARAPRDD